MTFSRAVEGGTLLMIGGLGLAGGLTSYIERDPRTQSSVMAPGVYIMVLGAALIVTALIYLYLSCDGRRPLPASNAPSTPWVSRIVLQMLALFAAYAYLIDIIGYILPTAGFLLLEFRLLGVRSWKTNLLLTALVAGGFYIVFIKYCEMVFPHGILFE